MDEKQKCCELVREDGQWGGFHRHQCPRDAKVERDGKGYCKQHDPVERKAKSDAAYAKVKEKWKYEEVEADKEDRMRKAYPLLVKALQTVRQKFEDCTLEYPDMEMVDKALKAAGERN